LGLLAAAVDEDPQELERGVADAEDPPQDELEPGEAGVTAREDEDPQEDCVAPDGEDGLELEPGEAGVTAREDEDPQEDCVAPDGEDGLGLEPHE